MEPKPHHTDVSKSDAGKGAVEGDRPEQKQQGNPHGKGLDEQGLPDDKVATCEDAIGANADGTEG
jgi:hypothetical protein